MTSKSPKARRAPDRPTVGTLEPDPFRESAVRSPAARRGAILAATGGAVPRRVKALVHADDTAQGGRVGCWRLIPAAALPCCLAASGAGPADAVEDLHLNVQIAQNRTGSR
ncbi:hypothetical protein Strvi_6341 [Streptomyces violaceusniger Tu 4113]|uniref:Uncharacterized protein n=1 Tax=Streptomyces violaceusniger (strain Tu 4113) TaxID=653045 RepID=G2P643_STRV4|nr:hypothetical protein Strvi_6341 [Streptomyces violaceusniger Tu 4113]